MKISGKLIALILFITLTFTITGCNGSKNPAEETAVKNESSVTEETQPETTEATTKPKAVSLLDCDIPTFELTSESLKGGVWDTSVTNTVNGSNQSPQLSWEPVADAQFYSIYMIDTTAGNWAHWISSEVTETTLPQGWAPKGEYIGPYPPSGTHDYEIYVFALKEQPSKKVFVMLNSGSDFFKSIMALDKNSSSDSGNIISYGHIKGTYTYGD